MDQEDTRRKLDDWVLDEDYVSGLGDATGTSFRRPADETTHFSDNSHFTHGNTAEYLELSEDESIPGKDLGAINTVGLADDDERHSLTDSCSMPATSQLDMNPWDGLPYSLQYYNLLDMRKQHVVWQAKDDFILSLDESSLVLVTGRAGTGKSTQIPQWCAHYAKELGFQTGTVVCTQPYSLAAASLALRVSKEMDLTTSVGNEVGCKTHFSDLTSEETILKFCSDEVLLREMAEDPYLERYGIVIVDETQVRTVYSDMLLSLLRVIVSRRDTIKVVVISSPHEMPKLEEYFEGVPVVDLSYVEEARNDKPNTQDTNLSPSLNTHRNPKLHFKRLNELHCDYVSDAVDTTLKCHCDQSVDGNILVFMPGEKDIHDVCERVSTEAAMRVLRGEAGDLVAVPLFETMPCGNQQAAYHNTLAPTTSSESGLYCRTVIVCDAMAESSFSMDNIAFVIDSGREISKAYDCRTRSWSHILRYTTKRSAGLRYARCKKEGHVYRLYAKAEFQNFKEALPPALARSELSTDVLLMKRLLQQLDEKFSSCQTIDQPAPDAYMQALEDLDYHGALDESGDLSDLGAVMSEFPVSLTLAKSLVASCGEQCTEEMLTIASMLTASPCFVQDDDRSSSVSSIRRKLYHPAGDHFTLLQIYEAFVASSHSEYWCKENGFRYEALWFACKVREVLESVMRRLELPLSNKIMNEEILASSVKKALLAGFFMQVAKDVDGSGNYLIVRDRHVSRLRKSTSLVGYPDWVLYHDFILSDTNSIVMVTTITAEMIAEISPSSYLANLPNGEAKDDLLKAANKLRRFQSRSATTTGDQIKGEVMSDAGSSINSTPSTSTSARTSETTRQTTATSSRSNDCSNNLHGNRTEKRGTVIQDRSTSVSDPVSDLISATTNQLTHAYQQASEYFRDYASVNEENDQDGCKLQ